MIYQEDKDREEMLLIASNYGAGLGVIAPKFWLVFRRGAPRRPMRVDKHTHGEQKARAHFEKLVAAMRQGSVGLVSPEQKIVAYHSEPMVRTRW